uniref:sugar transferase n=1 Tax=Edaphosphingomonas laterariae TaxID=861865 RepID=UPI001FE87272|nr:sugar transferase [Sphingomonas laterariae]
MLAITSSPNGERLCAGPRIVDRTVDDLVIIDFCRHRGDRAFAEGPGGGRASRIFDVIVAVALLVLLLPVLLLLAAVIYLTDRGPVTFAHTRVGRGGRPFACYKFRSMHIGAEERLQSVLAACPELREQWERTHKLQRDPRITAIGALLRVTCLDELPQLFNVIRGDMSLVGPRPIIRSEIVRYGRWIDYYYRVRPGLTGVWQVTRDEHTSYRRRVAADVVYVRSRSFWFDLRILLATIPAVMLGRGAC